MSKEVSIEEKLKRINELYHLSKERELTSEEKAEQDKLRKEYAANVRGNLRGHLENLYVKRPDGTIEKVKKVK